MTPTATTAMTASRPRPIHRHRRERRSIASPEGTKTDPAAPGPAAAGGAGLGAGAAGRRAFLAMAVSILEFLRFGRAVARRLAPVVARLLQGHRDPSQGRDDLSLEQPGRPPGRLGRVGHR